MSQRRGISVRKPTVSHHIRDLLNQSIRDDLIITPLLAPFLTSWDGAVDNAVAHRLSKIMSVKPRRRSGSWSASSAGHCMRRQELQFLGQDADTSIAAQTAMIFLNGTWVHLRWQAILMTAGLLDNVEVVHKKPSIRARCTMDGLGTAQIGRFDGRDFGFELKGRNDFIFNSEVMKGVDNKTRLQVDFEFMITGLDVFVIMNENKNNQGWKEWVFVRDDDRVSDMRKQVAELNTAIDRQRLHPMLEECKKQLKSGEFYKCPFGGEGGACVNAGSWPRRIR